MPNERDIYAWHYPGVVAWENEDGSIGSSFLDEQGNLASRDKAQMTIYFYEHPHNAVDSSFLNSDENEPDIFDEDPTVKLRRT